jgi:hypothetical protein
MGLRQAGFFRELPHGQADGPSLVECRRDMAQPDEARVASYLGSAAILAATGSSVDDYFNPANKAVARLMVATDGTWQWPLDLGYYVREYHVELPAEFVAHMRQRSWEPPELTHADLVRLTEEEFRNASNPT